MMLALLMFLSAAAAAPALYDQRQEGKLNFQADVKNVVLVVAIPEKSLSSNLVGSLETLLSATKNSNKESQMQERSDMRVMEAFVEPSEPYKVEIGESTRNLDGDGRIVEVVISGRRSGSHSVEAAESSGDELKLLGAMENCGPGRERDADTMACRDIAEPPAEPSPETGTLDEPSVQLQPLDLYSVVGTESAPVTTKV